MLKVNNLACLRNDRLLFHHLNFALNPGEILHIHGANGVGKSSLLRILCGLLEPAEGEILWRGHLSSADPHEFHRAIGYLGHKLGLKERLTVAENVKLFESSNPHFDTLKALERMGVLKLQDHVVETLSAGQKQRVALARLLAKNCKLWLLDEPFTAVDSAGISVLETVLHEHVKEEGMVVLTSHQPIKLRDLFVQTLNL
jgi:heme exporter protein A